MTEVSTRASTANRILAALPRTEYQDLLNDLDPVELNFGEILYEPGDAIRYVYFPIDALVSLLIIVDRHLALEVGMVGYEGIVGVAFSLGANKSPVRAMVQGTGTAMRMKAGPFRKALKSSPPLQKCVYLYAAQLMIQVAQTASCNRFHVVEERLARWLLMTRDRVGSNHFRLTHDFLGNMLGVRRVGVTNAAYALKQRSLIDYSRGNIVILDGPGLEDASCSCYGAIKGKSRVG